MLGSRKWRKSVLQYSGGHLKCLIVQIIIIHLKSCGISRRILHMGRVLVRTVYLWGDCWQRMFRKQFDSHHKNFNSSSTVLFFLPLKPDHRFFTWRGCIVPPTFSIHQEMMETFQDTWNEIAASCILCTSPLGVHPSTTVWGRWSPFYHSFHESAIYFSGFAQQ